MDWFCQFLGSTHDQQQLSLMVVFCIAYAVTGIICLGLDSLLK